MGELRLRLGDNPTLPEVVDHFIQEKITEERYLVSYAIRGELRREWPKNVGKITLVEMCKNIAARYDRGWSAVYKSAVLVIKGKK